MSKNGLNASPEFNPKMNSVGNQLLLSCDPREQARLQFGLEKIREIVAKQKVTEKAAAALRAVSQAQDEGPTNGHVFYDLPLKLRCASRGAVKVCSQLLEDQDQDQDKVNNNCQNIDNKGKTLVSEWVEYQPNIEQPLIDPVEEIIVSSTCFQRPLSLRRKVVSTSAFNRVDACPDLLGQQLPQWVTPVNFSVFSQPLLPNRLKLKLISRRNGRIDKKSRKEIVEKEDERKGASSSSAFTSIPLPPAPSPRSMTNLPLNKLNDKLVAASRFRLKRMNEKEEELLIKNCRLKKMSYDVNDVKQFMKRKKEEKKAKDSRQVREKCPSKTRSYNVEEVKIFMERKRHETKRAKPQGNSPSTPKTKSYDRKAIRDFIKKKRLARTGCDKSNPSIDDQERSAPEKEVEAEVKVDHRLPVERERVNGPEKPSTSECVQTKLVTESQTSGETLPATSKIVANTDPKRSESSKSTSKSKRREKIQKAHDLLSGDELTGLLNSLLNETMVAKASQSLPDNLIKLPVNMSPSYSFQKSEDKHDEAATPFVADDVPFIQNVTDDLVISDLSEDFDSSEQLSDITEVSVKSKSKTSREKYETETQDKVLINGDTDLKSVPPEERFSKNKKEEEKNKKEIPQNLGAKRPTPRPSPPPSLEIEVPDVNALLVKAVSEVSWDDLFGRVFGKSILESPGKGETKPINGDNIYVPQHDDKINRTTDAKEKSTTTRVPYSPSSSTSTPCPSPSPAKSPPHSLSFPSKLSKAMEIFPNTRAKSPTTGEIASICSPLSSSRPSAPLASTKSKLFNCEDVNLLFPDELYLLNGSRSSLSSLSFSEKSYSLDFQSESKSRSTFNANLSLEKKETSISPSLSVSERVNQIRKVHNLTPSPVLSSSLVNNQDSSSYRLKQNDLMRLTPEIDEFEFDDDLGDEYIEDDATDNVSSIRSEESPATCALSSFLENENNVPESTSSSTSTSTTTPSPSSHQLIPKVVEPKADTLSEEAIRKMVEDIAIRIFEAKKRGSDWKWLTLLDTQASGDLLEKSSPLQRTYKLFLYDLCKDIILTTFRREAEDPSKAKTVHQLSNIIRKPVFPESAQQLSEALQSHVLGVTAKRPQVGEEGRRRPNLRRDGLVGFWRRSKKRDIVDTILFEELWEEDGEWTHFEAEEDLIKDKIVDLILEDFIDDAIKRQGTSSHEKQTSYDSKVR